jgi:plasmid maintenance system killer protein
VTFSVRPDRPSKKRKPRRSWLGYKLDPLKGDMQGHWSVWVNGNWRVTFRFVGADVELVDDKDYQ